MILTIAFKSELAIVVTPKASYAKSINQSQCELGGVCTDSFQEFLYSVRENRLQNRAKSNSAAANRLQTFSLSL
jgi:hypothetical protein